MPLECCQHVLATRFRVANMCWQHLKCCGTTSKCWPQHPNVVTQHPGCCDNTVACCHNIPSNVVAWMPCRRNTPACYCNIPSRSMSQHSESIPSRVANIGYLHWLQSRHPLLCCRHRVRGCDSHLANATSNAALSTFGMVGTCWSLQQMVWYGMVLLPRHS